MADAQDTPEEPLFSAEQQLQLQQLRLLEWLDARRRAAADGAPKSKEQLEETLPKAWSLTGGVELYDWQTKCISRWFEGDRRGTVKVVTGGGKTLLALAIAERLQRERPELRVAVIVPTVVLLHQWYDEILQRGNLPAYAIGRLGGGYKDDFGDGRRILIAVLASAHKQLARIVRRGAVERDLLLVGDECHRLGATEMSRVFETPRAFSLGLSATPERDDDEDPEREEGYDASLVGKQLGPIIYDFTLADALALGVVPPYTINHYGLALNPKEQTQYDQISRSISEDQSELRRQAPSNKASGPSFFQWTRSLASRGGASSPQAARLMSNISKRKALLHHAEARLDAVVALIRGELQTNPDARVILFHESIEEVMRLYLRLRDACFPVVAEHSELPGSIREAGLDLFRRGIAQIIVSARSLIEGFNVPATDVGIIVASSSSVRQRIQSLGRVLRRHRGRDGEEKTSCIHVLYARGTVDEVLYEKLDWEKATGVHRNRYFQWTPGEEPVEQPGPPRPPTLTEMDIDPAGLEPGAEYPGAFEGQELSLDSQGNIHDSEGNYAKDTAGLSQLIRGSKGAGGRFRVTPRRRYVLVRVPRQDDWVTIFVAQLPASLDFKSPQSAADPGQAADWVSSASTGDPYPFTFPAVEKGLRFKQKRGGVIAKQVMDGEVFARLEGKATDPAKGRDAQHLLAAMRALQTSGRQITTFDLNAANHAVFSSGGRSFFICALEQGLEFPE